MLRNLKFSLSLVFAVALVMLFQTHEAKAAWGDYDTSFGFKGLAIDTITGYYPRSTAIQTDGKILVTGYRTTSFGGKGFFLRRYLPSGQLDTSFGSGGAATTPETNSFKTDYRGDKIVIQANGKIAVAGWANGYYAVWQFGSIGRNDQTFGQNGLQILTGYPVINYTYSDMNIQSGKLLLSLRKIIGGSWRFVLLRLNSGGTLDGTFGDAGESLTGLNGFGGNGTVIESNGKITVSGVKLDDSSAKGLERKTSNGQTDLTFFSTYSNSGGSAGPGLVKMSNGKYALRTANLAGNGSMTMILDKFSPNGFFESSVSPFNGFQVTNCPEVFTNQTDGKVLLQFAGILFRLNNELDFSTMETNYCSNLSGMSNLARAAIQPDDKMVVAGIYNDYLMIVRLLPN